MKFNINIILFILSCNLAFCQVPEAFSFQGVAFDADGKAIANKEISIKAEVLKGSALGNVEYRERHITKTNINGLYSLNIGQGVANIGSLGNVKWADGQKFLSIAIDPSGGTNYTSMGVTQLLSVPYAFLAGSTIDNKPTIFVTKNPRFDPIVRNVDEINNGISIYYLLGILYQWISGKPEDVYVEYKNLPVELGVFNLGGDATNRDGIVLNNTDTIDYGIYPRNTHIKIKDKNKPLAIGKYNVKLVFRTKSQILDSVSVVYDIIDKNCRDQLLGSKILTDISCTNDTTNIPVTDITLDSLKGSMNLIAGGKQNELNTFSFLGNYKMDFYLIECSSAVPFPDFITYNQRRIELRSISISTDKSMLFDVLVWNPDGRNNKCKITYK